MNANSKPKAPKFKDWLRSAQAELSAAGITSARLDAELILSSVTGEDRAWLIAHDDMEMPIGHLADQFLARRLRREPLAYILGHKEFYGRQFQVTPAVLIPRPDTEVLIELLAGKIRPGQKLIDVGTGSGAIAITAKLEFPELDVSACDVSREALAVAEANALNLGAGVLFTRSDLLEKVDDNFDIICANLPYVDKTWQASPETRFEPDLALFAADGGLRLIERLLPQAAARQSNGSFLLLEADPRQHDAIVKLGRKAGYGWYQTKEFIVVLEKA